jgi:hypothetical protein
MPLVEPREEVPHLVPRLGSREHVDVTAAHVAAGVTGERVAGQQDHVDPHHQRADADAEADVPSGIGNRKASSASHVNSTMKITATYQAYRCMFWNSSGNRVSPV